MERLSEVLGTMHSTINNLLYFKKIHVCPLAANNFLLDKYKYSSVRFQICSPVFEMAQETGINRKSFQTDIRVYRCPTCSTPLGANGAEGVTIRRNLRIGMLNYSDSSKSRLWGLCGHGFHETCIQKVAWFHLLR